MDKPYPDTTLTGLVEKALSDAEPSLIALRRDIHAHPEIGFETTRTAGLVATELQSLGLVATTGVGRAGVVAEIVGSQPGPTLIVRADMDALPMEELTGLPYASQTRGKMHACGHDLHTAMLVGAARVLSAQKVRIAGRVRLVFQPAEETLESGAAAMIADGAARDADMCMGFHNDPGMPVGSFAYTPGTANASSDEFDITVRGRGGHGSAPHQTRDPIVGASAIIMQLQAVVARMVNPADPAVLTIGRIDGGTTHNIIPDSCLLQGTIRCRSAGTRDMLRNALKRTCAGVAEAMDLSSEVAFSGGAPPLVNDHGVLTKAVDAVREHFGAAAVQAISGVFYSEDFALFTEALPGCHLLIGAGQPGRQDHVHSSHYQPDERSIAIGAAAISRVAFALLHAGAS